MWREKLIFRTCSFVEKYQIFKLTKIHKMRKYQQEWYQMFEITIRKCPLKYFVMMDITKFHSSCIQSKLLSNLLISSHFTKKNLVPVIWSNCYFWKLQASSSAIFRNCSQQRSKLEISPVLCPFFFIYLVHIL